MTIRLKVFENKKNKQLSAILPKKALDRLGFKKPKFIDIPEDFLR